MREALRAKRRASLIFALRRLKKVSEGAQRYVDIEASASQNRSPHLFHL